MGPLALTRHATLAVVLVTVVGCAISHERSATWKRVRFRAIDGVRLDGRLYGTGTVGVVLSHMGRPGDTQADWSGVGRLLARRGYLVLTYNRRGVCPGGTGGCSEGSDDYPDHWKDIVGAVDFLGRRGARRTILIGASIGAMASLYAASSEHVHPVGLLEFGGINNASGYEFTRAQIWRISGRKLFLSARTDIYGGAESAREWYRWAAPPKQLVLVPGSDHGTDLLRAGSPQRHRLEQLIAEFVDSAGRAE